MSVNEQKLQDLVGRAVADFAAGHSGVMVVLGRKLGLYKALDGAGPLGSAEVAERAGCAERYVREWLGNQVASGYVNYHSETGKYQLSAEQSLVFADESSTTYFPLAWEVTAAMWADEPRLLEAFQTGKGIAWSERDPRLFGGVAAFYRNGYEAALVQGWLPSLTGIVEKLERGGTVADVGCGYGHSTVLMAKAFPRSRFVGYDTHQESIHAARRIAGEAGVENVEYHEATLSGAATPTFDLICFFDALHDMGNPLAVAQRARAALNPGGSVMLVEPFANDRLEDNINPVGRLFYAGSAAICVPHALSEGTEEALGAQAGEKQLADVFRTAGYSTFRRAHETPFNLILEARA